MKKWFIGLMCAAIGMASVSVASGQILTFEFKGLAGGEETAGSKFNDANLTASTISRGAGLTASANGDRFNATQWALESIANAVAGEDYMEFTITPQPGYQFDVSTIYIQFQRSATGPREIALRSSVDNYASDLDSNFLIEDNIATQTKTWTVNQANSSEPVTYRFYGYAEAGNGSGGIGDGAGDDLVVSGTVTPAGPAEFSVWIDAEDNFEVEQGTWVAIDAEVANAVGYVTYVWTTDMAEGNYATNYDGFGIETNAALGEYYATVTATDEANNTGSDTIHFSVVPPAVKYPITINPSINGTVTTTPADEAAANTTVTVNATPLGGYTVGTITVNGGAVTVSGNTFVMPAEAVTITVTFVESSTSGALIISQYYKGTGHNKWIEIYNPGATAVDLAAGEYRLGLWANENREAWKTDGAPTANVPLTGTLAAGSTFLLRHNSAVLPDYATADLISSGVCNFTGDDSVVLYTGGTYAFANVVDAFGLTGNTAADKSFVRKTSVTSGVNTDFNAADWDPFTVAQVEEAGATVNERVGYHSTGAAVFTVVLDKANGFTVEQGTNAVIEAEALNGVAPIDYVWTTDMAADDYTTYADGFNIKATAALGTYYATVTATDSSSPAQTASNTVTFSVVAPAVKYPIAITTPTNGTVTTTPATEAAANTTVTINATPADGYAVGTITVTAADTSNVPVAGNTFTMPAQGVTLNVTFVEYTAPDMLITFENKTLPGTYAPNTALLEDGKVWSTDRVANGGLLNDKVIGIYSARLYPATGSNAVLQLTEAYPDSISRISYWVASYGSDNMANVTLTVEVSTNGLEWTSVETLAGAADITGTMTERVIETIPENAVYLRFVATAQATSNKRINIDNIAISLGQVVGKPVVVIDGNLSGTVNSQMSLEITLQNAIAADWWFDLKDPDNQPDNSYAWDAGTGVFSFTPSKVGNYTLTATAVDASDIPIANKSVTLTILAAGADVPVPPIVIVPGVGFSFDLPNGYGLARVLGADTVVAGNGFTWTLLSAPTDYEVEGTTVTIKTAPAQRRLFRIYWQ